jgi:tetrahydromethanopterin:alpha-L-glutamate ligase
MQRIPIFTDDPGWHGQQLRDVFLAKGYEAVFVSLRDCLLDIAAGKQGVFIPGFTDVLPEGAFVRGVPGGTLQQVIFCMHYSIWVWQSITMVGRSSEPSIRP